MTKRIASARLAPASNCSSVPAASESPAPVTLTIPVIVGGVMVNVTSGEKAASASLPFVTTAPASPSPLRRAGHSSTHDACLPTRAADTKGVVMGKRVSVRVDLGGGQHIKKK